MACQGRGRRRLWRVFGWRASEPDITHRIITHREPLASAPKKKKNLPLITRCCRPAKGIACNKRDKRGQSLCLSSHPSVYLSVFSKHCAQLLCALYRNIKQSYLYIKPCLFTHISPPGRHTFAFLYIPHLRCSMHMQTVCACRDFVASIIIYILMTLLFVV